MQNFRAKPGRGWPTHPDAPFEEQLWTVAAARILLGPEAHVQAPPNLAYDEFPLLLDAGIDDWGGVSPVTVDHVNPEAPWPEIARLAEATALARVTLAPRLPLYPEHVAELDRWVDQAVAPAVLRASDALGLAREDRWAPGEPVDVPFIVRRDALPLELPARSSAATSSSGCSRHAVWSASVCSRPPTGSGARCAATRSPTSSRGTSSTRTSATSSAVSARFPRASSPRTCAGRPTSCRWTRSSAGRSRRGTAGATEVCLQGGIHPSFTGDYYAEVVSSIRAAVPAIHVHAFSALEVWQGAATLGLSLDAYLARLRDLGLGSLPGTAAEVLDDEVRAVICPDKVSTDQWLEVHDAAHRVGLRSNVTMMLGHVDRPRHWANHLLRAREQQVRSGGFTEFVPLPFVPMEAPIFLKGRARRGPTFGEVLLVHAVARLALHPLITNIQVSWVKLGPEGVRQTLAAGVNDLGGTLMNESISRAAGSEWGQELPPERMEALIRSAGRVPRQRTTTYGTPPAGQVRRSFGAEPLAETLNPPVRDAGLVRPAVLVRPGLVGAA